MSKFKNIKVRIQSTEESKLVQKAFFRMGYVWHNEGTKVLPYVCTVIYGLDNGKICYGQGEEAYERIEAEEYRLLETFLVPVIKEDLQKGEKAPPVGLRPRVVVMQQRFREISEAIQRYADAGLPVPPEWLDELREVNQNIRSL